MNFDIRKGGQLFGPHTSEELKALVASGEVSLTDTVVKEFGEELPVGEFLEKSRPLKLKVLPPAVPEARLDAPSAPPPVPPRAPVPSPSTEPPLLVASRQKKPPVTAARIAPAADPGDENPPGKIVRLTVVVGAICLAFNYYLATTRGFDGAVAIGLAIGRSAFTVLVCVAIRASRKNLRTARATWTSVLLGFILSLLFSLYNIVNAMSH